MKTTALKLPNGLIGPDGTVIRDVTIRQLDGDDEDSIRDKKNLRDGNIIDKLMRRVIVSIGHFDSAKDVTKLYNNSFLLADLTYLLVKLRIWGIDPIYRFDFTCENCSKISRQSIDLTTLAEDKQDKKYRGLKLIPMIIKGDDDEDLEIEFQPLYNKQMKLMRTIKESYQSEKGTRELLIQLKKVGGEKVNPKMLKKLSWRVRNRIREAIDETSGGIDTELEIECPRCSKMHKASMPVDVRDFFFPAGGHSSRTQTAVPFRASGTTPSSWDPSGDGPQSTSEDSPSVSEPGTSTS